MNAMIQRLTPSAPFEVVYKSVFGCAIGLLVLIGAICAVIGWEYSETQQAVAGVVGAILGALSVRRNRASQTDQ